MRLLPVFCDWLKMADKSFTYQAPRWRSRILRINEGKTEWEKRAWMDFKDTSSSSSIRGRFLETGEKESDGRQNGILHLDGNLGRFGKKSNLFGKPVRDSSKLALELLGSATDTYYHEAEKVSLRRVDLTANFIFGSATDASAYLDWCKQVRLQKTSATPYESGCQWKTENWSAKVYDKIVDLQRHKLGDLADELKKREGYVMRLEMTLRTDELKRLDVDTLDKWTPEMEKILFTEKFSPILVTQNLPSADDLIDSLPVRLATAVQAWRNGMDYRAAVRDKKIHRATFYRLKADLLPFGIDISTRCNVRTLAIRPRLIEMKPLHEPDWWKEAAA